MVKNLDMILNYYKDYKPLKLKDNMLYMIDRHSIYTWNIFTTTFFNEIWGTQTELEQNFVNYICRTVIFDYPPIITQTSETTALWLEIFSKYGERKIFDEYFKFISGWDNTHDEREIINQLMQNDVVNCMLENRYKWTKLFETTILEFNPLWNVDGVEGRIKQNKQTGTDTNEHRGNDNTEHRGYDNLSKRGNNTNVKTGNTKREWDGTDTDTTQKTTTESTTFYDTEKTTHEKDTDETETYNNVQDRLTLDTDEKTQFNSNDKVTYTSDLIRTLNLKDEELEMVIRQGNIGVVSSVKLLLEFRDFVNYRVADIVANDIVKSITKGVY